VVTATVATPRTSVGHGPDYEDRDDARVSTEALRARRDDRLTADREEQRERQETVRGSLAATA